ncbi:hypothetical protein PABG_12424 [Paracoccidioides brasiliensis Pb03]|nr:hypothetical protein PABG_12424 [Paracoccidioides brasiliensis Pb03]
MAKADPTTRRKGVLGKPLLGWREEPLVSTGTWRVVSGISDRNHFHSTTRKVLSTVSGRAKICFGHKDNPERFEPVVSKGDVLVVPARVVHRLLERIDGRFKMEEEGDKAVGIGKVGLFEKDPVYGDKGPLFDV